MEPSERRHLLPFALLAAVFGVAELITESIPPYLYSSLSIASKGATFFVLYDILNDLLRFALVPFALFFAFYVLASKRDIDLRRLYLAIGVSIFLGTMVVFLPAGVARVVTAPPPPGFTLGQVVFQSIGASFGSSLNHAFIGFSGLFFWQMIHKPPSISGYTETSGKLHGLEDLSIVGVLLTAVYFWEYLARAYQAMYPLGASNQIATIFASMLGAGSSNFYAIAVWQQALLLLVLPFLVYFLIARHQRLNPFVQGSKIIVIVFVWGLFLRTVPPFFYVYFARFFDPNAFPSVSLASTFANELAPTNLIGILGASLSFLFLGLTAVVFAFLENQENAQSLAPAQENEL
jgi:hypothetical protein